MVRGDKIMELKSHLAAQIPTLMVSLSCLCAILLAQHYLEGLEQRTVLVVDQVNTTRFDTEHQQRYRYFRDHAVITEKAFRQVLTEWERERFSQPPLHEPPETAHYKHRLPML
jgi:hypothetical protein